MSTLKDCPFCGGEAILCRTEGIHPQYSVLCRKCGLETKIHYPPYCNMPEETKRINDAVDGWNRRAVE